MIAAVRQALADLERFALPNTCLSCGRFVEASRPDEVMCGLCRSRMGPLASGCARCAQPLPPVGPCRFCEGWTDLAWVRSAVWLGPEARSAVHGLKYGGHTHLAAWMAETIARHVPRPARGILVPIPLGARRAVERGYNQAELLARAVATRWHLPVACDVLRRTRETTSQTSFDPTARRANVAGAFKARSVSREEPVMLIDDVLTTGATFLAAAAALTRAGWAPPGGLTFARALDAGGRIAASR